MYIHPETRAKKSMINKMTMTMSSEEIKQVKKNHAKNRRMIREQKNKHKNKNKLIVKEMI